MFIIGAEEAYLEMWLQLVFKVFFMPKCIKIIFFKKLFLRSAHQNDLKYIKKLIFSKKNLIF
jgi:hypothetical protein